MNTSLEQELLELNQRLLNCISAGDWETYAELCDESLSAFEPEAHGHLVEGLDFHKFYFDMGGIRGPHTTTMTSPRVRLLGTDAAIISYVRLVQKLGEGGTPVVTATEETRVWQRKDKRWRHVHFHRSRA